ncbi:MAG: hypothetical protein GWO02_05475, partial [Gammaproteobacteria bacterium]|nr:hypothetical protein [Gammaproteobacteria bacterium]
TAFLACGAVAYLAAQHGTATRAQRLLAPAFVLLAGVSVTHLIWLARDEHVHGSMLAFWVAMTPPILGVQIQAAADRARGQLEGIRDQLEDRVKERTAELA